MNDENNDLFTRNMNANKVYGYIFYFLAQLVFSVESFSARTQSDH